MIKSLAKRIRRKPRTEATPLSAWESLRQQLPDASEAQLSVIEQVQPYTMTSTERVFALCNAVQYVIDSGIEGSFVECGVWRGGSSAAIALTLQQNNASQRELWLYDTFEGMSSPTEHDVDCWGHDADRLLKDQDPNDAKSVWCVSALEEVQKVIQTTGYPESKTHYVVGKVEETLLNQKPEKIALLRLDTDWYESTRCELECLFPRLQTGGVIIIDDYGHWKGCRKAVDEYLKENSIKLFLNRIDYTGRLGIKLPPAETESQSLDHVA